MPLQQCLHKLCRLLCLVCLPQVLPLLARVSRLSTLESLLNPTPLSHTLPNKACPRAFPQTRAPLLSMLTNTCRGLKLRLSALRLARALNPKNPSNKTPVVWA